MAGNDGTFGQVHDSFWNDPEILDDWSITDRLFWLYLLTCPNRNILGIFEFSIKMATLHTGLSTDQIKAAIERFEKSNKIIYSESTREIAIKKWLSYRGNNIWNNENLVKGIKNCVQSVKNKELLAFIDGLERLDIQASDKRQTAKAQVVNTTPIKDPLDESGTPVQDPSNEPSTSPETLYTLYTPVTLGQNKEEIIIAPPSAIALPENRLVHQPKTIKKPDKQEKTPIEKQIFKTIWNGTIDESGLSLTPSDKAVQAKLCWEATGRIKAQFGNDGPDAAKTILDVWGRKRSQDRSSNGFWRNQPMTPQTLASRNIFGQLLESMRQEPKDDELDLVLKELKL